MITYLADVILSLCLSFLNLKDLLRSKQINQQCNYNITNQSSSWSGTIVKLKHNNRRCVVNLPFIKTFIINFEYNPSKFHITITDCIFLTNNKTRHLFINNYTCTNHFLEHYLKYLIIVLIYHVRIFHNLKKLLHYL